MHSDQSQRHTILSLLAAVTIITGSAGCSPNINLVAGNGGSGDDACVTLAEETIALSQQIVDIEAATGQIDNDVACRFIANEIQLVDDGCIAESDLPEGVDRESLILQQQQEFNCFP